jgi:hypothetical protein
MKTDLDKLPKIVYVIVFVVLVSLSAAQAAKVNQQYKVLCWNNLGMHCYNPDYSDIAILPPYNTLWAQVIKIDDPPQIVNSGITVEYSFPSNTYSAGIPKKTNKTNFWTYVTQLFSVNLSPNIGLAGKGLSGVMDVNGDRFIAEGIPLTEYRNRDVRKGVAQEKWKSYPYQLATIKVRDAITKKVLAQTRVVAPVSSELNCAACHADDGDATTSYPITPTGNVSRNILTLHDYINAGNPDAQIDGKPLMENRPVLCAKCHASAALNANGAAGVSNLSNAMHNHHKDLEDITPDTAGCYNCHPGEKTQCLRDTMAMNLAFNCTTCHGDMNDVSQNPSPWLNEPRCDSAACHGSSYALDQPLYRESKGHGQMYCAGCHDSPHAIAISREKNDAIKFKMLQGHAGTLQKCTVCHLTMPTDAFVHIPKPVTLP